MKLDLIKRDEFLDILEEDTSILLTDNEKLS